MKKYLILGSSKGIGGWQLYCASRAYYINQKGYKSFVIDARSKDFECVKLKKFDSTTLVFEKRMSLPPSMFFKRDIETIICAIVDAINYAKEDEIFVESTDILGSFWAEMIAEKTNGIHFSYLLHSHFENVSIKTKKFFEHKLNQGLLAGMTNKTVPELFGDYLSVKNDEYGIRAGWEDPLTEEKMFSDEIETLQRKMNGKGKIIGYFGSLNKPHFIKLCQYLENYFNNYEDVPFAFVSIGSSFGGEAENAQAFLSEHCKNTICLNFKEMYPVPKQLFEMLDICIASWGSSIVAARGGALTVRLKDDVDIKPCGIIGVNIFEPYSTSMPCNESLNDILDRTLFFSEHTSISFIPPKSPESLIIRQEKEDKWIRDHINYAKAKEYYQFAYKLGDLKNIFKTTIYFVFGFDRSQRIAKKVRGIFK